jgi:hypothetical protein
LNNAHEPNHVDPWITTALGSNGKILKRKGYCVGTFHPLYKNLIESYRFCRYHTCRKKKTAATNTNQARKHIMT